MDLPCSPKAIFLFLFSKPFYLFNFFNFHFGERDHVGERNRGKERILNLFERERERAGAGRSRERGRDIPKQALHCQHRAQGGARTNQL